MRYALVTLLALWLGTSTASAAIFTDETAFLSAVGSPSLESFEGLTEPSTFSTDPLNLSGFDMTITGDSGWRVAEGTFPDGLFATDGSKYLNVEVNDFEIDFAFATSIIAFGLNITDFGDVGGGGSLSIAVGGDAPIEIASSPPALANGNILFWGVTSDTTFSSVTLTKSTTTDGIVLDEIYFLAAPTSVPAPTGLTILLPALAALGLSGRKPGCRLKKR